MFVKCVESIDDGDCECGPIETFEVIECDRVSRESGYVRCWIEEEGGFKQTSVFRSIEKKPEDHDPRVKIVYIMSDSGKTIDSVRLN